MTPPLYKFAESEIYLFRDFTAIKEIIMLTHNFLLLASDNGLPILSTAFNGNSIVEQALIEKEKW
jgi:hypothetical protein